MPSQAFDPLLAAVREIASAIAAPNAADVDQRARFPHESIAALQRAGVLSAGVPVSLGGPGCSMAQQAALCSTLAQGCASSGMVLAMHLIQVGCMARHGMHAPFFRSYLRDLVEHQHLIGSVTSEVGTFGDTRSSICAVEREGERFVLRKAATTVSYGAHADALLVTARRAPDAAASDQVLVLVRKGDYTLETNSTWDTMGMRGTCSPGGMLASAAGCEQIVPGSYADSSAQSMVPYSHILWSSLWWGIAADAVARASNFVRGQARKAPGTMPPTATRLAEVSTRLQLMRNQWHTLADDFDAVGDERLDELTRIGWALRLNNLKISASEMAPGIVHDALQIVGILGYKNDSPFSLGRHYRDALSGALMVSNDRILAKNASMLLVFKDE